MGRQSIAFLGLSGHSGQILGNSRGLFSYGNIVERLQESSFIGASDICVAAMSALIRGGKCLGFLDPETKLFAVSARPSVSSFYETNSRQCPLHAF